MRLVPRRSRQSTETEPQLSWNTVADLPPEYRQVFIDAIEGHPLIQALRETRADGDIIRIGVHGIVDRALDELGIPRDHTPEPIRQLGAAAVVTEKP